MDLLFFWYLTYQHRKIQMGLSPILCQCFQKSIKQSFPQRGRCLILASLWFWSSSLPAECLLGQPMWLKCALYRHCNGTFWNGIQTTGTDHIAQCTATPQPQLTGMCVYLSSLCFLSSARNISISTCHPIANEPRHLSRRKQYLSITNSGLDHSYAFCLKVWCEPRECKRNSC